MPLSHRNRLCHFNKHQLEKEKPIGVVFPDSRRILKSIMEVQERHDRRYSNVLSAG